MTIQLSVLPPSEAIHRWNKFASAQISMVPYSFNPSLFNFYKNHFRWKPYYFLLYYNNIIVGVLPLVNTGKAWVSLPHFSYGGILTNDDYLEKKHLKTVRSLVETIKNNNLLSGFYNADYEKITDEYSNFQQKIFIRSFDKQADNHFIETEKITSILKLPESADIMFNRLSSNLKRKIKKGTKNGFEVKRGGLELLEDFYKVYLKNIFYLKSLSYSKKYFHDLFVNYDYGDIQFFVVYRNNKPVGSSVLVSYADFFENIYFATLREEQKYYVSDWLHWQMVKYAIEKTSKSDNNVNAVYSFGRSTRNSPVHIYKKHWTVFDIPLYGFSNIPDVRGNKFLKNAWRFVPWCIAKSLGSKLIKHIY